jgi:hypothetical protein
MRVGLALSVLVPPLLLAGCGPVAPVAAGVVSGASIPVFGRSPVDMAVSAASGRDCSVVNLDKGEKYCRTREQPPETQPFCTRSLGVPDCWAEPDKLPGHPHQIADGPRALTAEQEKDRTKWWPGLW